MDKLAQFMLDCLDESDLKEIAVAAATMYSFQGHIYRLTDHSDVGGKRGDIYTMEQISCAAQAALDAILEAGDV